MRSDAKADSNKTRCTDLVANTCEAPPAQPSMSYDIMWLCPFLGYLSEVNYIAKI